MGKLGGEHMATLKDVAAKAGVTVTTVSRVLNNRGYIGEETRGKVYHAMKELNYHPNEIARSLSKQRSSIIGVIVPHVKHPYFAELISRLEREASVMGYQIMLCNSHEDAEREMNYLEKFQSNRVVGIILCSNSVSVDTMLSLNVPVVNIERNLGGGTAAVECDNYQGGILAAEHLIACGCKKMINFSGVRNQYMPADAREQGFIAACTKHKISHVELLLEETDYYTMDYHLYIEKSLKENPGIDGIFASSDLIAAQVIQVCHRLNLKIPEDIKLVGFDDTFIASLTTPTITTIHQPLKEMANTAIQTVLKSSRGEIAPKQIILPVQLIKRQSTGF